MEQKNLDTLEDLEKENEKLLRTLEFKKKSNDTSTPMTISKPLYRGQESINYKLETTLERYLPKGGQPLSVDVYNNYLKKIRFAVESYTGKKWDFNDKEIDKDNFIGPHNYEFMAYVRHHGFPSPLLDWSQSLYIALFFAFQKASADKRVAIYTFVEYLGEGKSGGTGTPMIIELGPYVSTHKRHFMQQGQYTVCVKRTDTNLLYCSHEQYFSASNVKEQDLLLKYTLPGTIKKQILNRLETMNINAFTLFGSEDSLMEMLAFREIFNKI